MANFVYNFLQDSTGPCVGCSGDCSGVSPDPSGSGCFTCGSGCITYSFLCSGELVTPPENCDAPNRSRSNSTCTGAMCWEEGDVYQIGEYTYYNCDVWENFETDNEAAPDSSSSWQPLDLDCCEPIYTGSGIVDIPCALMVSGTGNCQIIYTFQGSPDDPANPFYEACDPNWDLSFSQLYYYTGVWQTYGPYCNIPDSDLYIKESGCSPTGTYDHPSGHQVKVRICTWCSGCDCPPSGSLNQQSDCYGGDCFGKTDGPETWLTYSGCLDDPLAPRP